MLRKGALNLMRRMKREGSRQEEEVPLPLGWSRLRGVCKQRTGAAA